MVPAAVSDAPGAAPPGGSGFITTRQGYRLATSTGGVLTGRGADIILIDDPLKPEEVLSDAQRQAANDWFDHTHYSRQNDKRRGAIVMIMQRLHEDDLVGHVLGQEQWEILRNEYTTFLGQAFRNLAAFSGDGALHFVCMDWRHIEELMAAGHGVYGELKNLCVWVK